MGPLPWLMGATSVASFITLRRFVPSCFCFSASLCSTFLSVLLGDLIACTPHVIRRGGCRQRDAPVDPLPLFASCLCKVEKLPCLATRQVCSLRFGTSKPQQSPDSSIWVHIGTKYGGGINSVSSHAIFYGAHPGLSAFSAQGRS